MHVCTPNQNGELLLSLRFLAGLALVADRFVRVENQRYAPFLGMCHGADTLLPAGPGPEMPAHRPDPDIMGLASLLRRNGLGQAVPLFNE
jgi:hypothetical protein